jgi:MPBQ/MSBQ methyltransferase
LRILDIGGGAGETARKLMALGHSVDIVVPSPLLADRCRTNAPGAAVHECTFEDFTGTGPFDICLFSESFQYIPLDAGLSKCVDLLSAGGEIVLADCFRSGTQQREAGHRPVGGGHPVARFRQTLADLSLDVMSEDDITRHVAPSVEIEQGLFNVVGYGLTRVDTELADKRPRLRWGLQKALALVVNPRNRSRLHRRLNEQTRNARVFSENNTYLMIKLRPRG